MNILANTLDYRQAKQDGNIALPFLDITTFLETTRCRPATDTQNLSLGYQ